MSSEIMAAVKECFPYPSARRGQLELIVEGIKALDGGAKNLLIDAPTGTGKTPIAITFARYYTRKYPDIIQHARSQYFDVVTSKKTPAKMKADALKTMMDTLSPHQAHMITSLKMLQAQYIDAHTRPLITLMQGKGTYKCRSNDVAPGTSCGEYESMYGDGHTCKLSGEKVCAYADAKLAAQFARQTLHNFDSFIAQASLGGSFTPRAILAIDEAHGAEQKVIDAVSFEIQKGQMLDIGVRWESPDIKDEKGMTQWVTARDLEFSEAIARFRLESDGIKNSTRLAGKAEFKRLRDLGNAIRNAEEMRRKIERYSKTSDKPWVIELPEASGDTIRFEPVKGSYFAKGALTGFGHKNVLLSATILDKGRRVMAGLNLKAEETAYIATPCLFPVDTRRIVSTNGTDTGLKNYTKNLPRMAEVTQRILDENPGVRGVIHANSYGMARDIQEHIKDTRVIHHTSKDRNDVVNNFIRKSPDDAVLVGVFIKEGYDFKDDICRFQIIPRLPYPFKSKRIEARCEIETGYYEWLTCVHLMQECGRGTRSETDKCVTYIIDNRLGDFLRRAQHMMPQWFTEAIEIERK